MHAKGSRYGLGPFAFSHALYGKYAHFFKGVVRQGSSVSLHSSLILPGHDSSFLVAYISDW